MIYEYYCEECDIYEMSLEIEVKKKCPKCGYYMFVNEIECEIEINENTIEYRTAPGDENPGALLCL
jgi:hypothetical protein